MARAGKTFRIFVSSTFDDLKADDALDISVQANAWLMKIVMEQGEPSVGQKYYDRVMKYKEPEAQAAEYRRRCTSIGQRVRVELAEETVTGTVADLTDEGHLLLDVGACLRTVTAGDVVHVRIP